MNNDTIFLYIIAAIALCFGLINCIQFLLKRNRTAQTTGTIISIKMPNPETAKARNSKWAKVSYMVDGKSYQSQNRVQVPMALQVGSTVKVRYDKLNPEKMYTISETLILSRKLPAGFRVCIIFPNIQQHFQTK